VEGQIERICRLFDEGLVHGFALAGDENACTVREHADLFQILSDKGIPVEIHAGEWCGPESVWDAIEYGHPRRIGHGLSIFEDQSLLDQVLKQNIHIEFSPTSNAKLTDHRDIPKHPIIQARECEMNYSINTDDPGPFECSMHSECQMLADKLGFTAAELNRVYANSVDASFVSERQM
jgi:adenosine deaminase